MIFLGVDPGTQFTGYGVLHLEGATPRVLDYGVVRTSPKSPLPKRYKIIFDGLEELIEKYTPSQLVVETQFVGKNVGSAFKVGMVRGIVLLAAARQGVEVVEYTPASIKKAVVGNGRASKEQVARMLKLQLKLDRLPTPEDAADALAAAMCHWYHGRLQRKAVVPR